ncbi:Putative S-adenosyl-L-methionine-dependent methyltransferase [Mycobacterium simulans]|uniref:S-adenosyl-L-methionine-dependent methyltransferase n=1 Tax=Mycobacterium simulans TaxID=627089 RepID=A0A7Z7N998_9MYCO|nr:class I SAM-dependent methyltransferase [Mycobacterium simulans]SOJ53611.1 Putative S-adenosyl-L-methionine-dependent methyltransferase [Mycobacterium simulans]
MTRIDNDTWDLASSVGATATMIAVVRAMATNAKSPLINDPFAEPLVRAVGIDLLVQLASGELRLEDLGEHATGGKWMIDNIVVRTKFYDDFFRDAMTAGIRQAVILASGLDTRAYRLPWPAGTVVYEIDQPGVIEFKTQALADLDAEPTAERRAVAIDLRHDWPTALKDAGFDPTRPTAWSAEGLLSYLSPQAQDRLLDTITALSAPGGRLATQSALVLDPIEEQRKKKRMRSAAETWRTRGFDLDLTELIYFDERNDAHSYLVSHGWQVTGSTTKELFAAHGLPPFDDDDTSRFAGRHYISATLQ